MYMPFSYFNTKGSINNRNCFLIIFNDIWKKSWCIWSLAFVQYFLGIKVPTGFTAALIPPHVLTEVLLSDDTTVHRPLVPRAFVGQSS